MRPPIQEVGCRDSAHHDSESKNGPVMLDGAQKTHDPVCGMTVDRLSAKHKVERDGNTYFFCSSGCKAKFLAHSTVLVAPVEKSAESWLGFFRQV